MAETKENSDDIFGESDLLALAVELEVTGRMQSSLMISSTRAKNAGSAIRDLLQSLEVHRDKRPSYGTTSSEISVQLKKIERLLLQQEQRLLRIESHLVDSDLSTIASKPS